MIRSLGSVAIFVAFSAAAAQDAQKPTLRVTSFHVVKPDEGLDEHTAAGFLAIRAQGTKVAISPEIPGRQILTFDLKSSKVEIFKDDKNTDLLAVLPHPVAPRHVEVERIGSRAKINTVFLQAPGCPTRGATKVHIKGKLVAIVGKDEKQVVKKRFTGTADLSFGTIAELKQVGFGGNSHYTGDKPLKSITLVARDGKKFPVTIMSSLTVEVEKKTAYRTTLRIDGSAPAFCTLRVTYFDSVEEVNMPVDLEVGLGF
jgi:hypothetical protein